MQFLTWKSDHLTFWLKISFQWPPTGNLSACHTLWYGFQLSVQPQLPTATLLATQAIFLKKSCSQMFVPLDLGYLFLEMPLPTWWIPTHPSRLNSKAVASMRQHWSPGGVSHALLYVSSSVQTYSWVVMCVLTWVFPLRLWMISLCSLVPGTKPLNSYKCLQRKPILNSK